MHAIGVTKQHFVWFTLHTIYPVHCSTLVIERHPVVSNTSHNIISLAFLNLNLYKNIIHTYVAHCSFMTHTSGHSHAHVSSARAKTQSL